MRSLIATFALVTALLVPAAVEAFDEAKYPDWKGQWRRAEPGPPRGCACASWQVNARSRTARAAAT